MRVNTVLGPIDSDDLGMTLVHEHVFLSYPGDDLDPLDRFDRAAAIDAAVDAMKRLQDHGVRTYVDPCPIELGRDPTLLAEVAERSGMNIICSTGFYHDKIGLPYYWRVRSPEEIADLYRREIDDGIGTTGIKPGVIKIASGKPPSNAERRVISAAAAAARDTGTTVITHCEGSAGADVQIEILTAHGVDPGRCMIGHQDEASGASQLIDIARQGFFTGIDRIGIEVLASDDHRLMLARGLIDAGFAGNLCLSQDHACFLRSARNPYRLPSLPPGEQQGYEALVRDQTAGVAGVTRLFDDFLPRLRDAGVDDGLIGAILIDNPRRLFGGSRS